MFKFENATREQLIAAGEEINRRLQQFIHYGEDEYEEGTVLRWVTDQHPSDWVYALKVTAERWSVQNPRTHVVRAMSWDELICHWITHDSPGVGVSVPNWNTSLAAPAIPPGNAGRVAIAPVGTLPGEEGWVEIGTVHNISGATCLEPYEDPDDD